MYRSDGYRVKGNDPMYEIVPHIMPQRYDASNSIKVNIDLEPMQDYIRECRRRGVSISHMSIIIAGYLRLVSQNPYLNRFVMNKKIYARNHFCVSFVTLTPGAESDTVSKLYFNLDDTLDIVNDKTVTEGIMIPDSDLCAWVCRKCGRVYLWNNTRPSSRPLKVYIPE